MMKAHHILLTVPTLLAILYFVSFLKLQRSSINFINSHDSDMPKLMNS